MRTGFEENAEFREFMLTIRSTQRTLCQIADKAYYNATIDISSLTRWIVLGQKSRKHHNTLKALSATASTSDCCSKTHVCFCKRAKPGLSDVLKVEQVFSAR